MDYWKAKRQIKNLRNRFEPEKTQHGSYLNKGHWRRYITIMFGKDK